MAYDLLIRGGRVVDGSGLPSFLGDVGIRDGKVVDVGHLTDGAARTIDATGQVVAAGFIDHHTHMDAQVFWDPYGTSEPQHGITSIVTGNCGLTLAPVADGGEEALVKSFARVEAMPREALVAGVPWGWHSYPEFLQHLDGKLGINVGGLVGHIAVRHRAMGEDAVEREATAAEIANMQALVREALAGGALGLSTNRNSRHMREDGKPIATRAASVDEIFALIDVLAETNTGIFQIGSNEVDIVRDSGDAELWPFRAARRTWRPVVCGNVGPRFAKPNAWKEDLAARESLFAQGYRVFGIAQANTSGRRFTMQNCQLFDEMDEWKKVMWLPKPERMQALGDPAIRLKLAAELAVPPTMNFHRRLDLIRVQEAVKPENGGLNGCGMADIAKQRGQDMLDAFLDLSIEEELETTFWTTSSGDPEASAVCINSPYTLVGTSDAGAHVQFRADFGYGTNLLGYWVRERGALTIEQAVRKLSFQVASVYGIEGRGLLRPGYAADLTIFDPETVGPGEPVWSDDFPTGARHMIRPSQGVSQTVVNGRVIYEDGKTTGDLPGQVLRGSGYQPDSN